MCCAWYGARSAATTEWKEVIVGGCAGRVDARKDRNHVAVVVDAKALVAVVAHLLLLTLPVQACARQPRVTQIARRERRMPDRIAQLLRRFRPLDILQPITERTHMRFRIEILSNNRQQ